MERILPRSGLRYVSPLLHQIFGYHPDLQGITLDKNKNKDCDDNQDDQLFHNIELSPHLARATYSTVDSCPEESGDADYAD